MSLTSQEILTVEDAATLLRLEPEQIYQLTRARARCRASKPIPVIHVGKFLRFRRSSLLQWLSELESSGAAVTR
ncbi:MAG: helix-turn-helix domain-containing protein [Terriglobales bacterium]